MSSAWSGVPASRDPPPGIDLSKWKRIEIGSDIFKRPVLVAYWSPRFRGIEEAAERAYNEAAEPAWKAYDEAVKFAEKAYKEAVKSAVKAYEEAAESVERAYNEAMESAEAYNEAVESVEKAYAEAVKSAEKAYNEALWPARKAYQEAQAHVAAKYLFHPPATEYVLYRGDEDLWVRTKSVDGAGRLFMDAASEMRAGAGTLRERLTRGREFAAKGVTLARFDPGKVFVRRHQRRR